MSITYQWRYGTAYDFFFSLQVLHRPERFNVRPAWAAGMRSRIPSEYHALLSLAFSEPSFFSNFAWLTDLPDPVDAKDLLADLEAIAPADRLERIFFGRTVRRPAMHDLMMSVRARGRCDDADIIALQELYNNEITGIRPSRRRCEEVLALWADPGDFGEAYLAALRTYYDVFFHEEENRIRPHLEAGITEAKRLAERLPFEDLFKRLSQGVALSFDEPPTQVVFAASFWSTPYIFVNRLGDEALLTVFGARPLGVSLVPGEAIPEPLVSGLKALGDPTRLRILRSLHGQTLTPTQIASNLRLRTPTVLHHLDQLRSLGLVQLTVGRKERYYTLPREANPYNKPKMWY